MQTLPLSAESLAAGTSANNRYNIVVDTNVLISALYFGGTPETVLRHICVHHTMILSDFIVEELVQQSKRKLAISQKEIRFIRTKLEEYCHSYEPDPAIKVRDINDTDVVALAREYHALIITGDQDLLGYRDHTPMAVLSVADYTELFID
ncbi:putative toxin-antitoxin system toxin component, PIN family [Candidatus Saccharibacteria bacterium]|nr:MAG: putative toxin-antitoxin system toxin component, PIN family [Candidatus Saccharibacteria bacterium]